MAPKQSSAVLWPSSEKKQKERDEKKAAILETAVRLFNQKGFRASSLDDVALALNITKPTIYHYFKNKDEILFACVLRGLDEVRQAAAEVKDVGGSGYDRLRALMRNYANCMTQEFCICITRTGDHELSEKSRKRFREIKREIDLTVREIVEDGMQDGTIAKGNPVLVTFMITGALNWIARWFEEGGSLEREEIVDGAVNTLTAGLVPR